MDAQHIANFFLEQARKDGREITQLKLLKLVYIAYGWVGAVLDRELFEEGIEAWKHGPVVPSLYHEFKVYGNRPIDGLSVTVDLDDPYVVATPRVPRREKELRDLLSLVWGIYSRFSAWDLVRKTHEENTPWSEVYDEKAQRGKVIPYDLIKSHFERKIREYLDVAARSE